MSAHCVLYFSILANNCCGRDNKWLRLPKCRVGIPKCEKEEKKGVGDCERNNERGKMLVNGKYIEVVWEKWGKYSKPYW